MGCIRETAAAERPALLAAEYLASVDRGEKTLVVAQTWDEVNRANEAIREALRSRGKIGEGVALKILQTVDLSEAQKRRCPVHSSGSACRLPAGLRSVQAWRRVFHRRGERPRIGSAEKRSALHAQLPTGRPREHRHGKRNAGRGRRPAATEVQRPDARRAANRQRELVTVREVKGNGSLEVETDNGATKMLAPDQRLFRRGYAVTSYASQGKTVDTVLVADSACRVATNGNQWYVAISRAGSG